MAELVQYADVAKHKTKDDCWVVIHGKVYDVTSFLDEHPGGAEPFLEYAGTDATPGFEAIHPKGMVKLLPAGSYKGVLDAKSVPASVTNALQKAVKEAEEEEAKQAAAVRAKVPPLSTILNVFDMEAVAASTMKQEGWDYYSSGADDEVTLRENAAAFQRIWLRPRVLVDVAKVNTNTTMLGSNVTFPLYITATALGKLAHPQGEKALTRACAKKGIIHMVPTLGSFSLEECSAVRAVGQDQWFQLYVNSDRKIAKELILRAQELGMKALFVTVDAPELGRRERDMRNKFTSDASNVQQEKNLDVDRNQGTARALSSFIDPSLSWKDIAWMKTFTKIPIILKGVQVAEDAIKAVEYGCAGVVLSNHGGRQLDTARSGIEILPEVMQALRARGWEQKIEVFVDGGVRRGTDIFKALALGAKGVGIGRPTLYGLAAYGQDGVERVLDLLRDEFEVCMRLMGVQSIKDIRPEMVIASNLGDHVVQVPKRHLQQLTYIPMETATHSSSAQIRSKL